MMEQFAEAFENNGRLGCSSALKYASDENAENDTEQILKILKRISLCWD